MLIQWVSLYYFHLIASRQDYPQDSWLDVMGEMTTQTIDGERRLTIKATKLTKIPEPRNPYEY